jgi:predicted nucleic acid-binding protein
MVATVPTKVVDASAIAAVLFQEPEAARVVRQLDGHQLVASPLLDFEMSNVCLTKLRRHPDRHSELWAGFRWRSRLAIEINNVDYEGVLTLAEQTRLSFYDASYMWLARQLRAALVTLDRRLAEAAEKFR